MRVDWFDVAFVAATLIGPLFAVFAITRSELFAPECSAEQAEVLGPGTYKCLTLENGKRVWWKVEDGE